MEPVLQRTTEPRDRQLDNTLRPTRFSEFIGQRKVVENLRISIAAAKKRKRCLDHVLLSGGPGLGKTTLANLIAREMGTRLHTTTGPALVRAGDLAGILTSLGSGDLLFIDEIHRIPAQVEEYLYSAMESFRLDIVLDPGPHARIVPLLLPPFTLIGATTREGLLSDPFRGRFVVLEKLELYGWQELRDILRRSARLLALEAGDDALSLLAQRARGTPRIANRFLRRVGDLATVKAGGKLSPDIAREGLEMLGVDEEGLDATDRKILQALSLHGGGPLGLKTIAISVGEEDDTIEEVYEPYLVQKGFLEKSPRGRILTERARKYLGIVPKARGSAPARPNDSFGRSGGQAKLFPGE